MTDRKDLLYRVYDERLMSTYLGRGFETCGDCGCSLAGDEVAFITTKEYHYGEVVMEYAVCAECNERHQAIWSEDSRDKVARVFQEAVGAEDAWKPVCEPVDDDAETSWDHCWITGSEVPAEDSFQIVTLVQPSEEPLPSSILLSNDGLEQIQSILSKQTRDERDRWRERIYPRTPPGWQDFPDPVDDLLFVGGDQSKLFG